MEEKWFETYTWNGEPDTRYIAIQQRKFSLPLREMIEKTLKAFGFEDETDPMYRKVANSTTIVDLSSKTFEHISRITFLSKYPPDIPFAYPSQIQPFMAKHFGSLAGHQYGI